MPVIWLSAGLGAGKSAVGRELAAALPGAAFLDGDDLAGPRNLPNARRWRMALDALLRRVARRGRTPTLVVAYPLDLAGHARLRAACGAARRALRVVNLATPLPMVLRGRGGRHLDAGERARARAMRSLGYHRRRFAALTLFNAHPPAARTARRIVRLLHRGVG